MQYQVEGLIAGGVLVGLQIVVKFFKAAVQRVDRHFGVSLVATVGGRPANPSAVGRPGKCDHLDLVVFFKGVAAVEDILQVVVEPVDEKYAVLFFLTHLFLKPEKKLLTG